MPVWGIFGYFRGMFRGSRISGREVFFFGIFSGVAPANQTKKKSRSWTFRRGIPEQKFDMWTVLVFLRKKTPEFTQKWARNSYELFVLALSLVWFAGGRLLTFVEITGPARVSLAGVGAFLIKKERQAKPKKVGFTNFSGKEPELSQWMHSEFATCSKLITLRAAPEVQGDEFWNFGSEKQWWICCGKFDVNLLQEKQA